jgi:hypothetical protein
MNKKIQLVPTDSMPGGIKVLNHTRSLKMIRSKKWQCMPYILAQIMRIKSVLLSTLNSDWDLS